jgi:hypothetical protein
MTKETNDYDRLLPGEQTSMSSGNREDVRHWVTVYAELVDFKEKLLDELHKQRTHVSNEGQTELENDETLLQTEAGRLKRRLRYWTAESDKRS